MPDRGTRINVTLDSDAEAVTTLLESIPGAFEGLSTAEEQVKRGEVVDLEDL